MNKPSDQQPSSRPSTPGDRTQTNTPPSTERIPETGQETADEVSPNAEIKDPPEDDDAKAPLRAKKHNGDGASE